MPEKEKDELQLPQCEICMKVLSNDSMRPNCLERHLKQQQLWFEDERIFSSKAESLKRMRLDKSRSYHIAKKPRTIGEELIKPCVLKATQIILGEGTEQKIKSISFSNKTAKRRIDDIAAHIRSQIINKVKLSPFLAISCYESTDIVNCAQLIVYVRYID
ncbi:unnamed protein product [Acanthoscelides obtectus]|uniref:Uncharacterized protein n=1 Tax=Acanthoscelides obtectus TaxID=200917 RepID=A0A9P0LQQ1_ACAOB|nr:unnamed protein product [Acanthoscelides obtectus]CAK1621447.1 Protein ZBED8 [Acanthoscelides obtectus]